MYNKHLTNTKKDVVEQCLVDQILNVLNPLEKNLGGTFATSKWGAARMLRIRKRKMKNEITVTFICDKDLMHRVGLKKFDFAERIMEEIVPNLWHLGVMGYDKNEEAFKSAPSYVIQVRH